jgi:hypothetical protein
MKVIRLAAAILLCGSSTALAHDFFLVPRAADGAAGRAVEIAMHVSDTFPGDPSPWRPERVHRFFLADGDGRLELPSPALAGDRPRARVSLRSPGTAWIALVTNPSYIELAPDDFAGYLEHEGHDDVLRERRAGGDDGRPGRERYTRFVKTLVRGPEGAAGRRPAGKQAGGAAGGTPAGRPLGLPIEIVPRSDPGAIRPGGRLEVQVLFEEAPYAGGRLCATHDGYSKEHDAYAWCGRLDGDGRAAVPVRAPGLQLLRITRMRRLQGDPKADWESFWAALTFEVSR